MEEGGRRRVQSRREKKKYARKFSSASFFGSGYSTSISPRISSPLCSHKFKKLFSGKFLIFSSTAKNFRDKRSAGATEGEENEELKISGTILFPWQPLKYNKLCEDFPYISLDY